MPFPVIHGLSDHRLFRIYTHIKDRCYNPNNDSYHNYGGKGIRMSRKWLNDFMCFYKWALKNGYRDDLTIERKNLKGNYSSVNCTWATRKEQGNNRSTNRVLTYNGESLTMQQWSEKLNIKYTTIKLRLRRGMSVEQALSTTLFKDRNKVPKPTLF